MDTATIADYGPKDMTYDRVREWVLSPCGRYSVYASGCLFVLNDQGTWDRARAVPAGVREALNLGPNAPHLLVWSDAQKLWVRGEI